MIVCLCRRVSDRDIRAVAQSGVTHFELMLDETGAASQCGRCRDCAREVFEEAVAACGTGCAGRCQSESPLPTVVAALA